MPLEYVKHEKIWLKNHPEFNEAWLAGKIADDPSILGLGDIDLLAQERIQPHTGRLDLLLQDPENDKRYEVELMLGATDPSHIIRCLEYWDVERKRYPFYDHTAVLVAESITARFLNVIGLFNSTVPIIALQLDAIEVEGKILLHFTKVLDEIQPGDEPPPPVPVGRTYWDDKAPTTMHLVDACFGIVRDIDRSVEMSYKKAYIGLAVSGSVTNFVLFIPRKAFVLVLAKPAEPDEWAPRLKDAGLEMLSSRYQGFVRFKVYEADIQEHRALLRELFQECYDQRLG